MHSLKTSICFALVLGGCNGLYPGELADAGGVDGGVVDPVVADLGSPARSDGGAMPGRTVAATQASGRYFPDAAPWYQNVSKARVSPESQTITSWMVAQRPPGGWGGGGRIQVDFSIVAVDVPAGTSRRTHQDVSGFTYSPDCDTAPVPVPQGGAVEETDDATTVFTSPFSAYNCPGFDRGADCHMLFLSRGERRLYEIYHATIDPANTFRAGCLAIWDLASTGNRGQQCTSADAAGFPIAPLLFTPEEVQAGEINHAIRFILPNDMLRRRVYVGAGDTRDEHDGGPRRPVPTAFACGCAPTTRSRR